jgi:hypothetical protein
VATRASTHDATRSTATAKALAANIADIDIGMAR